MGREIRMVIPNYQHPMRQCPHSPWQGGCDESKRNNGKCYQPRFETSYTEALAEWMAENKLWQEGKHPDQLDGSGAKYKNYAEWAGNPPDVDYYSPDWKPEEKTWFQVFETVSEGTPVSPPFATREELVDYLVASGDFWDQTRGDGAWSREAATAFVMGDGWAPSFVSAPATGLISGVEALAIL